MDFFSLTNKTLINKWVYLSYLVNNYYKNSVNFLFFINLYFNNLVFLVKECFPIMVVSF